MSSLQTGAPCLWPASGAVGEQAHGLEEPGEKPVVDTPWFRLIMADVELPGGRRLDHYVLRLPPAVPAAVLDAEDRVLMLWRRGDT